MLHGKLLLGGQMLHVVCHLAVCGDVHVHACIHVHVYTLIIVDHIKIAVLSLSLACAVCMK